VSPRADYALKRWQDAALVKTSQSPATWAQTRTYLAAGSVATVVILLCGCGGGSGTGSAAPENAVPQIISLSPDNANAEEAPFMLTVNGSKFLANSSVSWNDTLLPTTYVSAVQLTAEVPSTDLAGAGTANVRVRNPAPGGGTSAGAIFTVNAPQRGTPGLVQFASFQTTNADGENDSTVQFEAPTKAGDAIWVAVTVADFGGVHAISVSDTQGNGYTLLDQKNDGQPGAQTVAHFYASNIVGDNGTPDTITIHWSFDNYKGILAGEVAGVTGAPLVGHSANIQDALNGGTDNVTSGAIPVSSAQAPALLVALSMNTSGGASDTGGSGFGGPAGGTGFLPRTMVWEWGAKLATLETSSIADAGSAVPLFNAPSTDSYLTVAAVFH
jgi:IPT/TIG domain